MKITGKRHSSDMTVLEMKVCEKKGKNFDDNGRKGKEKGREKEIEKNTCASVLHADARQRDSFRGVNS